MAFKVYLSPSNQPENTYNGINTNERDNCRAIAQKVKTALERCGIAVKIGLNGSGNISESNAWPADLHVPIHTNAYNKKARGTSVMVYETAEKNLKYATPIFNALRSIVLKQDAGRGISARTDLKELNGTTATAVYIEVDFHDVPEVAKWLVSEHDLIAEAICKGICEGAGITYKAPASSDQRARDSYIINEGVQPALAIYMSKLLLNGLGYGLDGNGYIGTGTDSAIRDIQKKSGIAVTGRLDADTADAIVKLYGDSFGDYKKLYEEQKEKNSELSIKNASLATQLALLQKK